MDHTASGCRYENKEEDECEDTNKIKDRDRHIPRIEDKKKKEMKCEDRKTVSYTYINYEFFSLTSERLLYRMNFKTSLWNVQLRSELTVERLDRLPQSESI